MLKCLNGNKGDAAAAAKQLVELAVHKLNSNDNVTVGVNSENHGPCSVTFSIIVTFSLRLHRVVHRLD